MKLTVKIQSIEKINAQALVIGLFEKTDVPRTQSQNDNLMQSISDMVAVDGFQGRLGEVSRVLRPMGLAARELVLVGLGAEDKFDEEALTRAARAAFAATRAETVAVMIDDWRLENRTDVIGRKTAVDQRGVLGVGIGVVQCVSSALVAENFEGPERDKVQGNLTSAQMLGIWVLFYLI